MSPAWEIAAENGLYDFKWDNRNLTIEPSLSRLETRAAESIRRIVEQAMLDVGNADERATLSQFLAVQFVRTRAAFEQNRHAGEMLKNRLKE